MSESSEYTPETTPVVTTTEPAAGSTVVTAAERKPNRLYQAVAWVAIVAGTVFIVAVVFFSGFILGKHSGGPGHFGWHEGIGMMQQHESHRMHHDGRQGWPGGPGMMRPGGPEQGGPGNFGPGGPGPGVVPQTPPTR